MTAVSEQHDDRKTTATEATVYDAGEINHLRALIQGTDRWFYVAETAKG